MNISEACLKIGLVGAGIMAVSAFFGIFDKSENHLVWIPVSIGAGMCISIFAIRLVVDKVEWERISKR